MKNLIFGLLLLCLPMISYSQAQCIEHFYSKYKGMEEVTSINLSGEMINFVFSNSDDKTGALAQKITKLSVLIVEKGSNVKSKDYQSFLKTVKKENFQELMRFKDGGDAVDFHLKEDGETITNVLVTVYSDDGFVLLSLEGLFEYSDLKDLDLNIEGAEHFKKLPEKKEDIDRA